MDQPATDIMKLGEVAAYLRVHPSTVYRMLKHRSIPAMLIASEYRFSRRSIDAWLKQKEGMQGELKTHA